MIVSFCCQTCNASLKADARFSGRAIRCPRCGQTARIPELASVPSDDVAPKKNVPASSSADVFAKFCAAFEPNPFAFSFPLDAPETAFGGVPNRRAPNETAAPASSEPNEERPMFYREEFMRRRAGTAAKKNESESPERPVSKSPSVGEMIAGFLDENDGKI